jgi:hypothetical protein
LLRKIDTKRTQLLSGSFSGRIVSHQKVGAAIATHRATPLTRGIFNQTGDLIGAAKMTRRCGILSAVIIGASLAAIGANQSASGVSHAVRRLSGATHHEVFHELALVYRS